MALSYCNDLRSASIAADAISAGVLFGQTGGLSTIEKSLADSDHRDQCGERCAAPATTRGHGEQRARPENVQRESPQIGDPEPGPAMPADRSGFDHLRDRPGGYRRPAGWQASDPGSDGLSFRQPRSARYCCCPVLLLSGGPQQQLAIARVLADGRCGDPLYRAIPEQK